MSIAKSNGKPARLRLFIVECPDPMDLLERRSESQALERICTLFGYDVVSFTVFSAPQFGTMCRYIASINEKHGSEASRGVPLCIHIACHGCKEGLGFGQKLIDWARLSELIEPICSMESYSGKVILVISACGAGEQELTKELRSRFGEGLSARPPAYVFVTAAEEVAWDDAALSWTVFYHKLPRITLEKDDVKAVLKLVKSAGGVIVNYHRWDDQEQKYLRHRPE